MKDLSHILKECSVKDIYYVNSGTVTYYKFPSISVITPGNEMRFLH